MNHTNTALRSIPLFLAGLASCSCYAGIGAGGGIHGPETPMSDSEPEPTMIVEAKHGLFGPRGGFGFAHQVLISHRVWTQSTRLEVHKSFHLAPEVDLSPSLSLGLWEIGRHDEQRLTGGFASPGVGLSSWYEFRPRHALYVDLRAEYRVRPWDSSASLFVLSVGYLNLSRLQ
jgi:hypothetical protein